MRVLLVGSGAREHALAWKLCQSAQLAEIHAAPGNPGIATLGTCHPVREDDGDGLLSLARSIRAGLVVIGPEGPLVAGVADHLRHAGIPVFGPSGAAARIEGSKTFAKEVMRAAGVAIPETLPIARVPCVVKLDGLASGKGVFVCTSAAELDAALRAAAAASGALVIEELLEGEEVSVFAVCDGAAAVALPAAQDYKRALDGDRGANTGGMGSFSPVAGRDAGWGEEILDTVHRPVLAELAARGTPFVGLLYAGLMITAEGPRVLEFNCRFGDPETQSILPRLDADLLDALAGAAAGSVAGIEVGVSPDAAVTVVVAAGSYPESASVGTPIHGTDDAEREGATVFHAGTALRDGRLVTNGGRILGVTGVGPTLGDARSVAYRAAERISFAGARYRSDIALSAASVN
jgi:phosphoribosylamine---glycine ligase